MYVVWKCFLRLAFAIDVPFPPFSAMFLFCVILSALCCGSHMGCLITDVLSQRNFVMAKWDSKAMGFFS